jgi:hypothetical protein
MGQQAEVRSGYSDGLDAGAGGKGRRRPLQGVIVCAGEVDDGDTKGCHIDIDSVEKISAGLWGQQIGDKSLQLGGYILHEYLLDEGQSGNDCAER